MSVTPLSESSLLKVHLFKLKSTSVQRRAAFCCPYVMLLLFCHLPQARLKVADFIYHQSPEARIAPAHVGDIQRWLALVHLTDVQYVEKHLIHSLRPQIPQKRVVWMTDSYAK